MIIYGWRGLTSTIENGQFHCPQCSSQQSFRLRQVRNFFTLYFIPVIPLNVAGRFIECQTCKGTFTEETRNFDPAQQLAETCKTMMRVMILSALADGEVDINERDAIKQQYFELKNDRLSDPELDDEIRLALQAGTDLNQYVAAIRDGLTPQGKGLVVKVAYHTMAAHGTLEEGHQVQLQKLAKTLQVPDAEFIEFLQSLESTGDTAS